MLRTSSLIQTAILSLSLIVTHALAQTAADLTRLSALEEKIEQGRYAEIEGELMKFVIANQGSARAFQALARVRVLQDRLAEAKGLFQRALALDKGLVHSRLELATVELRLGRREEGLDHLGEVSAPKLSSESRLKLAQTFVLFGEFKAALDAVTELPVHIQNGAAVPIRAISYLQLGEDQKLAALVRTAERLAVSDPALAVKFAEVLSGTRFNKRAMPVLRSVVAAHPKDVGALLLLARVEINERDVASAKKHVLQAAALAPGSAEVAFAEAMLAKEGDDPKATLAHLETSLLRAPGSVQIMRELVIAAMRANQPPRAIEIARKLMALQPSEPEFVYLYGAATLQIGRFNEAEEYLERYAGTRPTDPRGCVALGISLISQPAKVRSGQSRLERCIAAHPKSFEAAFQLGLSYKDLGESEKAIELFERALSIAPEFAPALRELGTLQLQAGLSPKARASLEKAVALDPNDANTHFQLSRLYNLSGEADRAKLHFEKFQTLRITN